MTVLSDGMLPMECVAKAQDLCDSMDKTGFGVLHDAISETVLAQMRGFVAEQIERRGGQYFGLSGAQWINETCLRPLYESAALRELLDTLYERKMHAAAPAERIYPVMRALTGTHGLRHANNFHYDSYMLTVLVPILIPDGPNEPPGHLVMFPNMRNARRWVVVNIVEKLLVENVMHRVWRLPFVQRLLAAKIVPLTPGNLYFFWGMRSLHANQACLPSSVRCTVLLHFGDPHEGSRFKGISQRLHAVRLRRMARD
ncbi:hypothetical protein [Paraburkholderia sp. J41]|uniref:hypothetical protein n=1 Tax=Paraburkholderia sp. J41 TaxID=2805433 RepID=UPI002AC34271|nr:hypothetical protein [Paraburkholderia sp. J41]